MNQVTINFNFNLFRMSTGGNQKTSALCDHDFNDPAAFGNYHQPTIAKTVDDFSLKLEGKIIP